MYVKFITVDALPMYLAHLLEAAVPGTGLVEA